MPKVNFLKNLRDLSPDMTFPEKETKMERPRKCRKCGAEMEHIAGSNVWVCHGFIEEPDPTKEDPKHTPCNNFALAK